MPILAAATGERGKTQERGSRPRGVGGKKGGSERASEHANKASWSPVRAVRQPTHPLPPHSDAGVGPAGMGKEWRVDEREEGKGHGQRQDGRKASVEVEYVAGRGTAASRIRKEDMGDGLEEIFDVPSIVRTQSTSPTEAVRFM